MADLGTMLRCGKLQLLHEHSPLLKVEVRAALFNEIAADASRKLPGARNERVGFSNSTEERIK